MPLKVSALRSLIAPLLTDGTSQNAVARRLGIEPSTLSRWLSSGKASYPQVAQVAAALKVPASRLWQGRIPHRYATRHVARATSNTAEGDSSPSGELPVVEVEPPDHIDVGTALWVFETWSLEMATMHGAVASMDRAIAAIARQIRAGAATGGVPMPLEERVAAVARSMRADPNGVAAAG